MGTLVEKNKKSSRSRSAIKEVVDDKAELAAAKSRKKTEKRIEKEYGRIRSQLEDIRQAVLYLENADSHDDVYFRLLQLEKITRRIRTGGAFSRGAKLHRRLLRSLNKSLIE